MKRKLFTAAFTVALATIAAVAVVALMPGDAAAFDRWAGGGSNCSANQCHGANFGGFGASLHDLHVPMTPDCNACHPSGGGSTPVQIGSSDGGTKASCAGCHVGTGLRTFHRTNNIQTCDGVGCHASLESPPPESSLPPYYGTVTAPNLTDPCNPTAQANINENWDGNFIGLDNDGDGLVDTLDTDCGASPPAAGANYDPGSGQFTSSETQVGRKAYSVTLNKRAGTGFTFDLTNAQRITPTGNPTCVFTGSTGELNCPVTNVTGSNVNYNVTLGRQTSAGFVFDLKSAKKNR